MARPGEVTSRAPEGSDYGTGAQLQRLQTAAPITEAPTAPPPQPTPGQPQPGPGPQPGVQPPPPPDTVAQPNNPGALTGDVSGGYDSVLFGPTDNPTVPVTNGMPFGAGSNFIPQPNESDREFMLRVASTLQESPGATERVKQLAQRIMLGG